MALEGGTRELHAQALSTTATLTAQMMDLIGARTLAEAAVTAGREAGSSEALRRPMQTLTWITSLIDPEAARPLSEEALELARSGDDLDVVLALGYKGIVEQMSGQLVTARDLLYEARGLLEENPTPVAVEVVDYYLGGCLVFQGALEQARAVAHEGLATAERLSDEQFIHLFLGVIGLVSVLEGDYVKARAHFRKVIAAAEDVGNPSIAGVGVLGLGFLCYAEGDLDAAATHLEQGTQLWRAFGIDWVAVISQAQHAYVMHLLGHEEEASSLRDEAITLARSLENPLAIARAQVQVAVAARAKGDHGLAQKTLSEALDLFVSIQDMWGSVNALEALAEVIADQQRFDAAARLLGVAEAMRERIGYRRFPVELERYEDALERVRGALGSVTFQTRWEEGRTMEVGEVLREVR